MVSLVFLDRGSPVLLSERYAAGGYSLKKIATAGTRVVSVPREAPPRLAGDVLLWQRGDVTLRLEGRDLTLRRAQELARALR